MARVQALLDSLGRALCDRGRRALSGEIRFGDVLPEIAKCALEQSRKQLSTEDIRLAVGEIGAQEPHAYAERLLKVVAGLERLHAVPFKEALKDYLSCWPAMVRQVLRRPSDPKGHLPPEGMQFYKADDLLMFLPARLPLFRAGVNPPHLEDWTLTSFRGIGECSEVWAGESARHPELSPAALKFITDPQTAAQVVLNKDLLIKVFELNDVPGIVPLRAVYLDCQPPCLDVGYVYGYDLTGLMHEWSWRYDAPKPDAAARIVRRLAEIVGEAHKRGVVHRDLKPSNVLFHPKDGGKFTVWVTDFGWGQIAAARSIELGKGGTPRGEQHRLELRGAYSPLYACPQLSLAQSPDPRDDVYSLGVIWFQLLKRCAHAHPPVGQDWADEFRNHGLTDAQAKLLTACLATRPDKRPKDAVELAERMHEQRTDSSAVTARLPLDQPLSMSGAGVQPIDGKTGSSMLLRPVANLPLELTNSVGMAFRLVPAGKFLMGAPDDEPGWNKHEAPVHGVLITKPFYLGIGPVTQAQFQAVMGFNPSYFGPKLGGQPDWPVENVTWGDAEHFCEKLELLANEESFGRVYRLPTEAEWEYACRAGESMPYFFGQKLSPKHALFATGTKTTPHAPVPAGAYPANKFGLLDMHGNVLEWVNDWYSAAAYFEAVKADPQGPDRGTLRVCRGGSWMMFPAECRSAARRPYPPSHAANTLGFRVVLQA